MNVTPVHPSANNPILEVGTCFVAACGRTVQAVAEKIKEFVTSKYLMLPLGFILGLHIHKIYAPITSKIVKGVGYNKPVYGNPFSSLGTSSKILMMPVTCLLCPIVEEYLFRGDMQGTLKGKFESFYLHKGFSPTFVNLAARASAIFFTSITFGLIHFTNALIFMCNPMLFFPQVVAATIMGLLFGAAKELSGELYLPTGMHIGNNVLAWMRT